MHARMGLAFDAASRAGIEGEFRVFDENGLLVVLSTARGLGFLNTVTITDAASIDCLPDVLELFRAGGAAAPIVVSSDASEAGSAVLAQLGLEPAGTRPIAFISLCALSTTKQPDGEIRVSEARTPQDRALFLDILLAGYEGSAEVERFIRAEHSSEAVSAYLAWIDDEPIAGAAMSVHSDGLVLGGSATLPDRRGVGAQTALLRSFATSPEVRALAHRETTAIATATAAPASPSLRTMSRAGFTIRPRRGWRVAGAGR